MNKTGKKQVRASSAPRYYRATDLMLAAVEYTRKGMPIRAAKALAAAAADPHVVRAMEQLGDMQQDMQDEDFAPEKVDHEQETSRALSRLIKASQQDEMHDEPTMDDDDQDADDQQEAGMDDHDDQDDDSLDLGMDDKDQDPQAEAKVQASVRSRLERAARNRKRRA